MINEGVSRDTAKYWWLQCVSCSEASMTTQMRGFGLEEPVYEQGLHSFSGGFMHLGHACGLLTGAAIAAGFLARERFDDDEARAAAALYATIRLAKVHPELAGSVNCLDITDVNLTSLSGRLRYVKEGKAQLCGRLHLKWSPQAHELINKSFSEFKENIQIRDCANCAVETLGQIVRSTGLEERDLTLVAGLAGGVGLLGNVCGALASGVYAVSVSRYYKHNVKERDSRLKGSFYELVGAGYRGSATQLRLKFIDSFGSELCSQITQRKFSDMEEYSTFIKHGGCKEVIEFVTAWVNHQV
jgi:hypothetical protein